MFKYELAYIISEDKTMKAKVGMRVDVFSPDKKKHLGLGEIVKVDDLIVEETGEVLSHNFPTIRLDTGKEVDGLHCWWYSIGEKHKC